MYGAPLQSTRTARFTTLAEASGFSRLAIQIRLQIAQMRLRIRLALIVGMRIQFAGPMAGNDFRFKHALPEFLLPVLHAVSGSRRDVRQHSVRSSLHLASARDRAVSAVAAPSS